MAEFTPSSRANPCPICSRTKDGDCRIGAELVLCHHGSSHHPPEGLRPGDTHPGGDGQQWAYAKDTSDGRAATFTPHKPLQPAAVAPLTEPPLLRDKPSWRYSATFYIVRKDHAEGGKSFLPLSWLDGKWQWRAPKGNRPMLLSHPLAAKPDATVLIVEGEKTWDAARRLFPGLIACCWSGGCKAISKTDFAPLAGRKVVLWPDNDDAGRDAMERLTQVLYGVGAASVKVVANPNDEPQGWDIADADWTAKDAAAWVKANTSEAAQTAKTTTSDKPKQKTGAEPKGVAQGDLDGEIDDELRREALERFRQAQQSSIDLIDVFGPIWGQLLIDRAAAFPCDPTVMLLPMLGYISSLIGTKVHVKVKQGWKEPMVVWGYIAQPPSSMKSPAGGVFGGPLAALQAQAIQNHAREFDGFKTREKRWKSECKRLETEAKKKGSQSADLPDPPETPTPARHYYIETITLERVASIHAQSNVVGLLAFHDELSDWFASLEKKAAQTDRPRWLKLWTGQAIKHDTQTSLSAFTDKTAISIVGFIQPDKLADLYQNESHQDTSSAGDGLWSRFLPVIPRTIPFKFNYLEVDLTEDLLHLARQLDDIRPGTLLSIPPHFIDNALQPTWERWAAMEGETSGARAAFIGKLRGYSVRFAGLLHLLNSNLGDIDPTTAQTAVNLCEFFLAQFDQISPQISSHEDVDTPTARFLQKVKDKDADCVRVRDLQRWKLLGKQASSKQCHDFLHSLAAQGIGSFKQVHAKGSAKGAWVWGP